VKAAFRLTINDGQQPLVLVTLPPGPGLLDASDSACREDSRTHAPVKIPTWRVWFQCNSEIFSNDLAIPIVSTTNDFILHIAIV